MSLMSALPFHTPEILGFYLPPALIWAIFTLLPFWGTRWSLDRVGLYRFVWHRPLFDTALYVILFGAVIFSLTFLK